MSKQRLLLITGGQWHPWDACAELAKACIEATGRYRVDVTQDRDALHLDILNNYAGLIIYTQGGHLTKRQAQGMVDFVARGGALIGIHSAAASWKESDAYWHLLGARFIGHGPVCDFRVQVREGGSMITQRIQSFEVTDELYLLDIADPGTIEVLATAVWQGGVQPIAYTKSHGDGQVFYLAIGHDERTFSQQEFQQLLLRGIAWALGARPRALPKAAIIGYGGTFNMGRVHAQSLLEGAGIETVAVCDPDPARREAAATEWPGIETFATMKTVMAKSDADLAVIVTPHHTHARLAMQALKAGRHVVLEKPFCLRVREANGLIRTAHDRRRMLSVFHNRRWDGDFLTITDLVRCGFIGDVYHVEVCHGAYAHPGQWWRSDKRISGGAFYDWGAHLVDWVLNLVPGPVSEISGYMQTKRVWHDVTNEDHCSAVLRFANGASAHIEMSHIAAAPKARWRILGSLGAIEQHGETIHMTTLRDGVRLVSEVDCQPGDWHAYYRNIADHLALDEPLAVRAESARRVIAVIETAYASSRQGRALPPPRGCS